ncbi:MAG: Outer-membrane lipoprotein LolB precursor [Betaproteobacteria bacterium ADurb.Bin341]|nr:MAG: Outer-membrane lipoprotein LolB precursor [Betaproteobacteria bacterium ADurb.Bin341]
MLRLNSREAMSARALLLLLILLLTACAAPLRAPEGLAREELRSFQIEARFSLRLEPDPSKTEPGQGASGRLIWRHDGESDHIVFSGPLGQGLAELSSTASGARLRLASGEERQARDAATLLKSFWAYPLPVDQLPRWLLGHFSGAGSLLRDAQGRPSQLTDAGWEIGYAYEDEAVGALPSRLTVRREGEFELRLRIEEWQINP